MTPQLNVKHPGNIIIIQITILIILGASKAFVLLDI